MHPNKYAHGLFCFIGFHCGNVNSLAPGRSQCGFKNVILNLASLIDIFKSSYVNVLRWMPQEPTDDKSTLVQVMAWCRQATSHYLNQCLPRSLLPYGITRPHWVNIVSFIHPSPTQLLHWRWSNHTIESINHMIIKKAMKQPWMI